MHFVFFYRSDCFIPFLAAPDHPPDAFKVVLSEVGLVTRNTWQKM